MRPVVHLSGARPARGGESPTRPSHAIFCGVHRDVCAVTNIVIAAVRGESESIEAARVMPAMATRAPSAPARQARRRSIQELPHGPCADSRFKDRWPAFIVEIAHKHIRTQEIPFDSCRSWGQEEMNDLAVMPQHAKSNAHCRRGASWSL
jgi:hypothetical protein